VSRAQAGGEHPGLDGRVAELAKPGPEPCSRLGISDATRDHPVDALQAVDRPGPGDDARTLVGERPRHGQANALLAPVTTATLSDSSSSIATSRDELLAAVDVVGGTGEHGVGH
jgi:hypothetical protein